MGLFSIDILAAVNAPPIKIGSNTLTVVYNSSTILTQADFTTGTTPPYIDPEGDIPENVKVLTLPSIGDLEYNGIAVLINDEIPYSGIGLSLFRYIADIGTTTSYTDTFTFNMSDIGSSTYSGAIIPTFTFEVNAIVNLPPTTGDNSTSIAHGATYVFTRASLTSGTTPAYNDPEGDAALNLRINFPLPSNGSLKWSSEPVRINDVIPFADIDSGQFTYIASSTLYSLRTVDIDFDIEDTGSGTFSS